MATNPENAKSGKDPDDPQERVVTLQAQAATLEAEGNLEDLCKVLADLGVALGDLGRAEEAIQALEACIDNLDAMDNPAAQVSALGMLGVFRAAAGQYQGSTDAFIAALELMAEMPPNVEEQIHCLSGIGQNLVALGDWQGALAQFTEVEGLARRLILPQEELDAIASKITLFEEHGDYQSVISLYERARVLFRLMGDREGDVAMLRGLAVAHGKLGDPDKAKEYLKQWEEAMGDNSELEEK